ncbi:MAG: SDR family NAD(P)-dependent oxidoreductase, partial [Acidobacteriota bacterium]
GHAKAIFSGVTTGTLADLVVSLIADHPALEGLLHVAAEPISKFGLLGRLRDTLELDVEVVPTTDVVVDRSLDGTRFRQATGWVAPSWAAMLARLGEEAPRYERLRGEHAAG